MPQDRFDIDLHLLGSPATDAFAVVPHNTNDLPAVTRSIYVGGTGDVSVRMKSGDTVLFKAVPVGTWLPIRATGINATGTTATNLVGVY